MILYQLVLLRKCWILSMSNIVFIPAVKSKHLNEVGDYVELSMSTWKHYCNRFDAKLVVMDEPIRDPDEMKMTWQRWRVHELLKSSGISYEKVLMVDVDTMVHWNAPNIFELDGFSACVDNDNVGWVQDSITGYKSMFNSDLDWETYFNCGMILMENKHSDFCDKVFNFYMDNETELLKLQHETLKKGSDQTPVNYLLNESNIKLNIISKKWNLTHLMRKEILNGLQFVNCGWIWHFNGFDKKLRFQVMSETWKNIKDFYG